MGPYIPSSPVKDFAAGVIVGEAWPSAVANSAQNGSNHTTHSVQLRDRDREAEEAARTMGQVHFGSVETTDELEGPLPVSRVAAELTDELTTPHSSCQLERNQPDLPPDSTDGKTNLASAELMETADIKGNCPLVDCQLDTVEDYLHQTTGNILAQATRSSGTQAVESIPGHHTGSFETWEAGSPEIQTAEESEVATIASSAECTSAHVTVI